MSVSKEKEEKGVGEGCDHLDDLIAARRLFSLQASHVAVKT